MKTSTILCEKLSYLSFGGMNDEAVTIESDDSHCIGRKECINRRPGANNRAQDPGFGPKRPILRQNSQKSHRHGQYTQGGIRDCQGGDENVTGSSHLCNETSLVLNT